jgi:hypothetical protein
MHEKYWGYEELSDIERESVDRWFAEHPEARAHFDRVRGLESTAAAISRGAIDFDPFVAGVVDDADEAASLRKLLNRIRRESPPRRTTKRRQTWAYSFLAAAAVASLLFWLSPSESLFTDIELLDPGSSGVRGGGSPLGTLVLRSGQRVELAVQLNQSSYVAVVHIAPDGTVEWMFPIVDAQRIPAGPGTLLLPGLDAPFEWILGDATGPELFLLAAGVDAVETESLQRGVEAISGNLSRNARVELVQSMLKEQYDEVESLTVDHRP